jgi:Uma2 family endonuclease
MSTATQLMTADELLRLPDRGELYELVNGELRVMSPAGFEHGIIGAYLSQLLGAFSRANRLGLVAAAETGFLITRDPDTVRSPDVAFVSRARVESAGMTKKYFPGAPDLAAEVISPSDRVGEVDEKVQQWLDAGTRLVWVINPRRREVTVYSPSAGPFILTEAGTLDGQDVVPGFRLPVAELFVAS